MPYRPSWKQEQNDLIEGLVPQSPGYTTVAEIAAKGHRRGTVRAALRRLVAAGLVTKAWHNAGYPVFFITPLAGEETSE
jgi:predicted transcriptional regulator